MATAKAFVLKTLFHGLPTASDFEIVEENLSTLKDGEFLAEALYITVDPYMRAFVSPSDVGEVFGGEQVAIVKETKNSKYPIGKRVVGYFGWRTHTIASESPGKFGFPPPRVIPDIGRLSPSLALGVLGMPGHTAYFGFLELCNPKEGDIVVISGAGGAVGSHVGQLAKIKGCLAVGIAGTDEKGKWLVDELGFDAFINYKSPDFPKRLEDITLKGIDSYFDNVGGEISSTILNKMNKFGRVAVCGAISAYNDDPNNPTEATEVQTPIKTNHLHVEGMNVFGYVDRWSEAFNQNLQWINEGKLKYRETITEGFENTPDAFIGLFHGNNIGKAIVKVK